MHALLSYLGPTRLPIQKPYSYLSTTKAVASPSFIQNKALLYIYRIFASLPLILVFCVDVTAGSLYRLTANRFISHINKKNQEENAKHLKNYLLKAAAITGAVATGAFLTYYFWSKGGISQATTSKTPATTLKTSWLSSLPTNIVPWIGLPLSAIMAFRTGSPTALLYGAAATAGINKMVSGPGFAFKNTEICTQGFQGFSPLLDKINTFFNWSVHTFPVGPVLSLLTFAPSVYYDLTHNRWVWASREGWRKAYPQLLSAIPNAIVAAYRMKEFKISGHALMALPFTKTAEKIAEGAREVYPHGKRFDIASYGISTLLAAGNALMIYNTVSSCHTGSEILLGFSIAWTTSKIAEIAADRWQKKKLI